MEMVSKTAVSILNTLLQNFPRKYNINQIARLIDMSVGGVHRTLKKLVSDNILLNEQIGNALFYKLNLENEECMKMLETIEVEKKIDVLSRDYELKTAVTSFKNNILNKALDRILAVFLFSNSDILILTSNLNKQQFTELEKELENDISKLKTKKISAIILTLNVFETHLQTRSGFYKKLWKNGVILYGESFLFHELIRGFSSE